ncbi:MAG: hypothetical protein JRJ85_28915 [Deltaproteobacteria bacterium]|nr:hypothetical protein [Deltaproteobacteria bacterium]
MARQLNLKGTEKEIDAIMQRLAATGDTVIPHNEGQRLKIRLEQIRNTLNQCLRAGFHNLNVLRTDSSAGLRNSRQIAGDEAEKIKRLIGTIDSALRLYKKPDKTDTAITDHFNNFGQDNRSMNKSESKDYLQVTYQTIALLDAERYGTTGGNESIEKYPKPDLGQRNCGIADKIRIGLPNSVSCRSSDYQIAIPQSCRDFHGGDI